MLKARFTPVLVVAAFLLPLAAGESQATAASKPLPHTLVGDVKTAGNLRIKVDAVRLPVVHPALYRAFNPKDQPRGRVPLARNEEFLAIELTATDVSGVRWDGDADHSWALGQPVISSGPRSVTISSKVARSLAHARWAEKVPIGSSPASR